jgi:hypothetical protein
MNKVGSKAAPSAMDFKQAAKTAKPYKAKKWNRKKPQSQWSQLRSLKRATKHEDGC